jgi:glutamate/aspartate transport system permease protein
VFPDFFGACSQPDKSHATPLNYHWNWKIFWEPAATGKQIYLDWLISGLGWTIATGLCAWVIALVLGSVIGVVRTTPNRWLARLGDAWVELFRNIPLLVQMFLWYFVMPEFLPEDLGEYVKHLPPPWGSFVPAVLCLGLFTSARVAEQVKAGVYSLPRGQTYAGLAMGLTLPQTYRYVLLPMAYRIVIPPLTSEFLNCIKNTSVALTISLPELLAQTNAMNEYTYQSYEVYTAATLIYVSITLTAILGMRWVEHKVAVPGYIGSATSAGGH